MQLVAHLLNCTMHYKNYTEGRDFDFAQYYV